MVKKKVKKKAPVKKVKKTAKKPQKIVVQQAPSEPKMDKVLVENFVSLQRVLTNLAVNVDNLSDRISKLLDLFEISAKALAEKDFDMQEENTDLKEKLDSLIDQNKTLARGVALMHERIPREQFPPPAPMPHHPQGHPLMHPSLPPQLSHPPMPPTPPQPSPPLKKNLGYTQEVAPESGPPPAPFETPTLPKIPKPPAGPEPPSEFEPPLE
jgi:hypothetical protein